MNELESIPIPETTQENHTSGPGKTDFINHPCTDNVGEHRITPKESLKYQAMLIPISVSFFCILIWLMNEYIPVYYPEYAHFFILYIFGQSEGGSLYFEILGGIFLFFGFFNLKYDLYKRTMDGKYMDYRGKNRLLDRNPVLSGIIYGIILILLLPVSCGGIIYPYLHYLPYALPIIHLENYWGIIILILLNSVITSIIIYLIPPSWEKTRLPFHEPKESIHEYPVHHDSKEKKRSHSYIPSFSHWLTLSAWVFPVTLITMIVTILIISSNRLRDYQITISGAIQTIPGFEFPSSFLSGNGPTWGLLILGYAAYVSLIYSAIYLISGYGTSDTIFNSGSRIMPFFWLPLVGLSYFTPYTLEIVNQDLVSQGIPKIQSFSSFGVNSLLIVLMALIIGYSLAYLDKRCRPEKTK